jgi:hypothetical protein
MISSCSVLGIVGAVYSFGERFSNLELCRNNRKDAYFPVLDHAVRITPCSFDLTLYVERMHGAHVKERMMSKLKYLCQQRDSTEI